MSSASSFLPTGGAHHPVQTILVPNGGSGKDAEGPVTALSHTIVTVSAQGIPPQTTTKINILLAPEFGGPELGEQFIFFLILSFYKK